MSYGRHTGLHGVHSPIAWQMESVEFQSLELVRYAFTDLTAHSSPRPASPVACRNVACLCGPPSGTRLRFLIVIRFLTFFGPVARGMGGGVVFLH